MLNSDISSLIDKAPRNCWLALNDEQSELVGHGDTPDAAVDAAQKNGVQEPVLIWSPSQWIPAVL
ncbi:MAG TPA: hypothetical protein VN810_08200 [Terriglobales bacterium]|jgi:hypothetical protein|nr:hypothetical protein [Terriglobales bacterium]